MMPYDYADELSTVAELLEEFGANATLTRTTGSTFDPVAGSYSGGTPVVIEGNGVQLDYIRTEIDGTVIQRGDVKFYFEPANGEPLIDDVCEFAGKSYRVINSETLAPNGTHLLYELQLRV